MNFTLASAYNHNHIPYLFKNMLIIFHSKADFQSFTRIQRQLWLLSKIQLLIDFFFLSLPNRLCGNSCESHSWGFKLKKKSKAKKPKKQNKNQTEQLLEVWSLGKTWKLLMLPSRVFHNLKILGFWRQNFFYLVLHGGIISCLSHSSVWNAAHHTRTLCVPHLLMGYGDVV